MRAHYRAIALTPMFILLWVGLAPAQCPLGDLNGDCQVNAADLLILGAQWLAPPERPADLDGDDKVDLRDFTLVAAEWRTRGLPLFINEVQASNAETIQDPQEDFDDWIEIYNAGDEPLDIGGMYLTDDLSAPRQWRVPSDDPLHTTIPPHAHLLIWADGDIGDHGLHANFALNADGDAVALFDRDGATLIDTIDFAAQETDISYGRLPDGGPAWQPLASPTPEGQNVAIYEGFIAKPTFSVEGGFYDEAILVALATETEGATIYYTTDGSEPYVVKGRFPTGRVYTEPISIDETTCLRAKAIRTGWRPSAIKTCTCLFVEDVIRQSGGGQQARSDWPSGEVNGQVIDYGMDSRIVNDPAYRDLMDDALLAIPSISLVTDLDNLFDASTGIYVRPGSEGRKWERPVSVELLNPDGSEGFQIDAGVRIRGGFSRSTSNPKHAFRLLFRPEYGGTLQFPLFGDEGTDRFENVDLRTSQNYSWSFQGDRQNTMVREVFSRDVQGQTGHPYTRSRYYHLYLNGQYWGLYQTQERSEASYAETYFGAAKDDYDVVKADRSVGRAMMATDGNMEAYQRLYDATRQGLADDEPYFRVQGLYPDGTPNPDYERLLDVDNLIDFMIIEYYTGDRDGPGSRFGNIPNNTYAIYDREHPDGWKWFHHDNEHTLGVSSSETNMVTPFTSAGAQWRYFNPHWLHERLAMSNDKYRMRFADRVYRHFFNDGLLTAEASIARIERRAQQIELAIIAESARWGDAQRSSPYTQQHWRNEVSRIIDDYLPTRTQVVLDQFKSVGWYPNVDPPTFNQHGGLVHAGFSLQMSGSGGTIYYTLDGSDPRGATVEGSEPAATTLVAREAAKRVLVPTGEVDDAWKGGARFNDRSWTSVTGSPGGVGYEQGSGYEGYLSLDLGNEMYQSHTGCYVRIFFTAGANNGFDTMTLYMLYDDGFVVYLNGIEILRVNAPGTPTWDSAASSSREALGVELFDVSGSIGLLNDGENVLAIHGLNSSATSSDFLISVALEAGTQSIIPDGGDSIATGARLYTGPIQLTQSTQVKAAALSGATWSALNEVTFAVGPVAESLRISEIMYHPADTGHPDDPNTEYIELTNIGTGTVNLNLVRFTNGIDFVFPHAELAVADYILVVKDVLAFEARYGAGLPIAGQYGGSLSNAGERIELQDAAGQTIHDFRFRDGWYDLTDGAGFSLTVRHPATVDPNALSDRAVWRPSAGVGGSAGFDDTGMVPDLGTVVINELMAYPEANQPDWIELHNTTEAAINIGGWFLSDDRGEPAKYEIAEGTSVPPHGYAVFYQDEHFGNGGGPGNHVPFGLSRNGEEVYLRSGSDGVITGYIDTQRFEASEIGVSVGRHLQSTGAYDFVAMHQPTPGMANTAGKVGPIVISEIMYNPAGPAEAEYVELLNISDTAVTLYDTARGAPWRFTDDPDNPGIEYFFPTMQPVMLAPGEHLLLASDLDTFNAAHSVPAGVIVLEWGAGKLANSNETVQLSRPGDENADGSANWIRVDRVVYSDGSRLNDFATGIDPWPAAADGQGLSLGRIDYEAYGNDPANWQAVVPSPGRSDTE